jgi:hypothetical protein
VEVPGLQGTDTAPRNKTVILSELLWQIKQDQYIEAAQPLI